MNSPEAGLAKRRLSSVNGLRPVDNIAIFAREAIRMASKIQKSKGHSKYALTMRWMAGHEGIAGNEAADKEAKLAAEGKRSEKHSLPPYLRKPLPTNASAVKQAHQMDLKRKWTDEWRASHRGRNVVQIDNSMPSSKFLKLISQRELSRTAASCTAQFRLTHTPVNQYLFRIGKVDSARCPACGDEQETTEHLLLRCQSYTHKRWALEQQAKKLKKPLTLETLLGSPEMIKPLANYIEATNRFRRTEEGEQQRHEIIA